MPARIGRLLRAHGAAGARGEGAVVRCILESLALKHAETVELLARVDRAWRSTELHVVGGGARNDCSALDGGGLGPARCIAGPEEATVVGNLLVQAMALGELGVARRGRRGRRADPSRPASRRTSPRRGASAWVESARGDGSPATGRDGGRGAGAGHDR